MSKDNRRADAFRFLGLARRAGAVVPGTDAGRHAVRAGEARLVLVADDASSVQVTKVDKAMKGRAVPRHVLGTRDELGAAVGRGPTSVVVVTGASFADELIKRLETERCPDELEE